MIIFLLAHLLVSILAILKLNPNISARVSLFSYSFRSYYSVLTPSMDFILPTVKPKSFEGSVPPASFRPVSIFSVPFLLSLCPATSVLFLSHTRQASTSEPLCWSSPCLQCTCPAHLHGCSLISFTCHSVIEATSYYIILNYNHSLPLLVFLSLP